MAMEVKQICHQYLCDIVEWFLVLILELILWWLLHRALAVEWQWIDLPVLLLFNIITCLISAAILNICYRYWKKTNSQVQGTSFTSSGLIYTLLNLFFIICFMIVYLGWWKKRGSQENSTTLAPEDYLEDYGFTDHPREELCNALNGECLSNYY